MNNDDIETPSYNKKLNSNHASSTVSTSIISTATGKRDERDTNQEVQVTEKRPKSSFTRNDPTLLMKLPQKVVNQKSLDLLIHSPILEQLYLWRGVQHEEKNMHQSYLLTDSDSLTTFSENTVVNTLVAPAAEASSTQNIVLNPKIAISTSQANSLLLSSYREVPMFIEDDVYAPSLTLEYDTWSETAYESGNYDNKNYTPLSQLIEYYENDAIVSCKEKSNTSLQNAIFNPEASTFKPDFINSRIDRVLESIIDCKSDLSSQEILEYNLFDTTYSDTLSVIQRNLPVMFFLKNFEKKSTSPLRPDVSNVAKLPQSVLKGKEQANKPSFLSQENWEHDLYEWRYIDTLSPIQRSLSAGSASAPNKPKSTRLARSDLSTDNTGSHLVPRGRVLATLTKASNSNLPNKTHQSRQNVKRYLQLRLWR